ncbi:MAG: DMT family transporter [Methyloligellaceae bacterium]
MDKRAAAEAAAEEPRGAALPFVAIALGAVAMGASPIFVRLADVGPFTSAFWRMALALPFLWIWLRWERARAPRPETGPDLMREGGTIALLGFLFAGDLFFWHLSIVNTTVANATLLATMTPIIVTLGAWLILKEQISARILSGVLLGITGSLLLVGASARFEPQNVLGDIYGLITAFFFGAYFLGVASARRRMSVATVMFYPAVVTTGLLFLAAILLDGHLLPQSWEGLATLVALAIVSQVGGQGLVAYALGYLPAIFSSLVIFFEAVAAAIMAWLIFAEHVTLWQLGGGALILTGIYSARPARNTSRRSA